MIYPKLLSANEIVIRKYERRKDYDGNDETWWPRNVSSFPFVGYVHNFKVRAIHVKNKLSLDVKSRGGQDVIITNYLQ